MTQLNTKQSTDQDSAIQNSNIAATMIKDKHKKEIADKDDILAKLQAKHIALSKDNDDKDVEIQRLQHDLMKEKKSSLDNAAHLNELLNNEKQEHSEILASLSDTQIKLSQEFKNTIQKLNIELNKVQQAHVKEKDYLMQLQKQTDELEQKYTFLFNEKINESLQEMQDVKDAISADNQAKLSLLFTHFKQHVIYESYDTKKDFKIQQLETNLIAAQASDCKNSDQIQHLQASLDAISKANETLNEMLQHHVDSQHKLLEHDNSQQEIKQMLLDSEKLVKDLIEQNKQLVDKTSDKISSLVHDKLQEGLEYNKEKQDSEDDHWSESEHKTDTQKSKKIKSLVKELAYIQEENKKLKLDNTYMLHQNPDNSTKDTQKYDSYGFNYKTFFLSSEFLNIVLASVIVYLLMLIMHLRKKTHKTPLTTLNSKSKRNIM